MVQRRRQKEQKQQHINGTENIILKCCTTICAQNKDLKPYGIPYVLENSWHVSILLATTNIRAIRTLSSGRRNREICRLFEDNCGSVASVYGVSFLSWKWDLPAGQRSMLKG
ncbi:hypothetical protein TNCV_2408471 [Trichonephila clavipes]|nr:hypothetical protein TNCV_2408471 [Trichonephila clavipes]